MTMSVPASKTSLDTLLAVFSTGTVITNSRDDLLDVTETAACLGIELMNIQIEVSVSRASTTPSSSAPPTCCTRTPTIGRTTKTTLAPSSAPTFAPDEVAVYNLASITVNALVKPDKTLDFKKLWHVVKVTNEN